MRTVVGEKGSLLNLSSQYLSECDSVDAGTSIGVKKSVMTNIQINYNGSKTYLTLIEYPSQCIFNCYSDSVTILFLFSYISYFQYYSFSCFFYSVIFNIQFHMFVRKYLPIGFRPLLFLHQQKYLISTKNYTTAQSNKVSSAALTSKQLYRFSDNKIPPEGNNLSKQQRFKQKTQEMLKQAPQNQEDQVSYSKSQNKLTKYLMGISVIALLMVYGMMEVQSIRAQKKIDKSISGMAKISSTGKANIGGQWQLVDTKGKPFGSKDLEGTYYLIYFGFTNCPDICPNSLIKLSRALQKIRKMPEYQYLNLKTIFVSVDPDRDTPDKIDKFLSYFDKSFIGVSANSNNDPKLKECMKKFKIYASKIEFQDEQSIKQGRKTYTIDHTVLTYLMSDDNQYLTHLGGNLGEHELAKIIVQKIIDNEHEKMKLLKAT